MVIYLTCVGDEGGMWVFTQTKECDNFPVLSTEVSDNTKRYIDICLHSIYEYESIRYKESGSMKLIWTLQVSKTTLLYRLPSLMISAFMNLYLFVGHGLWYHHSGSQ